MTTTRGSPPRQRRRSRRAWRAASRRRRAEPAAARTRRRAPAAGSTRDHAVGARSRSSAWSRRMKRSSGAGSSRTQIGRAASAAPRVARLVDPSVVWRSRASARSGVLADGPLVATGGIGWPDPPDTVPGRGEPPEAPRDVGRGVPGVEPRRGLRSPLFTLPLYTRHLTQRAARLRRDAADGDHPRQHRPALRDRRGVRALLLRRRRRPSAARASRARRPSFVLVVTTTVAALVAIVLAGPLSRAARSGIRDATLVALGVLGLWAFTNLEIAYALLRVEERRADVPRSRRVTNVAAHRRADRHARRRLRRRRARLRARQLRRVDDRAGRAVGLRPARPPRSGCACAARAARSARCCASARRPCRPTRRSSR